MIKMGKSKRRSRHRKKKVVESEVSSSSTEESDSETDTSKELARFNRKRKTPRKPSIIPDDAPIDVGNDDLYPAQETRFEDWDAHILTNLEYRRDLGLSQPDKERWDKALAEMILIRSIYNERRRTGREDIEVPRTPVEKSMQTFSEVEDAGTQVTFEDVVETEAANLSSHLSSGKSNEKSKEQVGNGNESCDQVEGGGDNDDGVIQIKEEVNEDDPDFCAPVPYRTTVFLDDIDDEDGDEDDQSLSHALNTPSISVEVNSNATSAPSSSGKRKSYESSTNVKEPGQKSKTPTAKITCSASEKVLSTPAPTPSTSSRKRKSCESSANRLAELESIPNHLNGDHETTSTSRNSSLSNMSRNSEDPSSEEHVLPNLPTYYVARRLRVLKGRKCLSEEEFFNIVESNNIPKTITICGSTGMGKTTFLAQMGRKILSAFPERISFYLQMKNVLEAVKESLGKKGMPKTEFIWNALRRLTGERELGKVSPNAKATRTELFFDNFYDVHNKDEKLVCNILKCISDSFNSTNIRMWIATVPNDSRLEIAIQNADSYSLEPLGYDSQVELIASYLEMHTSEDKPRLVRFVEKCIKDLAADDKCDLELGNPLQCLLIGGASLSGKNSGSKKCRRVKPNNISDIMCRAHYNDVLLDASGTSSFHTLKLFLDFNKFDINHLDSEGDCPLFLSVRAKGNIDCLEKLKLLIKKGADLDILNHYNENLLLYAVMHASIDCLNYILSLNKFDINCVDIYGNTPLFLSVGCIDQIGCLEKVKLLIKHKANLNHLKDGKVKLLLYVAQFSSAEIFEYILSLNKFDVNSEDDDGDTPLLLSVFQYKGINCLKKLEMAIAHGGNLNHVNKEGVNLLLCTAQYGSLDVLKYVINLGIFDINSQDKFGQTALYYVKKKEEGFKNVDMNAKAKLLKEKGCK